MNSKSAKKKALLRRRWRGRWRGPASVSVSERAQQLADLIGVLEGEKSAKKRWAAT